MSTTQPTIADMMRTYRRLAPAMTLMALRYQRKLTVARHRRELADVDRQIRVVRSKLDGEATS